MRTQACHGPLSPGTSMAAERRRRGPLQWHERHLDHFLDLLLDSFDDASLWLDLREYCHKKQWGFSSGCAGTESPAWILAATRRYLQARGVEFSVFHVASLKFEPEKRRWIQNALEEPPTQLFANVWDATDTKPHFEFMSGKSAPVDPGFLTKIWLVGFSCRTASFLNRSADDANVCISCRAGTTGDTFEAVVQTLRLRRPLSFACENVPFGQI